MAMKKPRTYKCMLGGVITSFKNAVDKQFCAIFITDCWGSVHKVVSDMSNKQTLSH